MFEFINVRSIKHLVRFTFCVLLPVMGWAQNSGSDTVLKSSVIEIVQVYKPQIKQTQKPDWIPHLPPVDTTHPVFTYIVPQQSLYYTYHSEPLHPLVLGKDTVPAPLPNYAKLGLGNLSTLYFDAGVGSLSLPDAEFFIHAHHLSQKGSIKYQQTALSGIEAEGLFHQNNNEWHTKLSGERNQFYFYGYNHDIYNYSNSDSLRQTFTNIRASVDYKRKDIGESKFDFHPSLSGGFYGARFNTSEISANLQVPFTYDIDTSLQALLTIKGALADFVTDSPSVYNNYLQITPGMNIVSGRLRGHANLGFTIGKNSVFHILPDVVADVTIPNTVFVFSAGWVSNLRQNTYEQLTTDNPYIYNYYSIKQTRFDELFAGMRGCFGTLTLSARASWWNMKSLPTYLDTAGDGKQFSIVYDSVSAVSIQFAGRYSATNKYSAGLTGEYFAYYTGTSKYAWNIPDLKIKGDFQIAPMPKLVLCAYISVMGGMHTLDGQKKVVTLQTYTDIGGNGEYLLNSQFSFFLQLSNLLNNRYRFLSGYETYGINIYGGVRMKF